MVRHYTALFAFADHYFYSGIEAVDDAEAMWKAGHMARAAWLDFIRLVDDAGSEVRA